jgi:type VI secretion system protein ImpL
LLIAASVISLLLLLAFTISFFGNQALEDQVLTAARAVPVFDARQGNLPSQDSLEKLESLRQSLFQLTEWEQAGPPLRLRWFLYTGGSLYPHTRQAYYNRFRQLLLGPTQGSIVAGLKALPVTSGPTDDYQYSYDSLKAYLITTPEWKRSTREFLSPVLMNRWQARREIDPQRTRLAKLQFDFYGDDLKNGNPYDSGADEQAVDRARRYLASFAGYERIYRFMLAEANKQNPPVNFNQKFPGSAEVVVNNKDVPGAFTKTGWTFMQSALKRADQYFGGERWVLGDYNPAGVDRSKLEQELRNRYNSEFIATWRQYLRNSSVVKYSDLKDAAAKLNKTSSNQSPLLALFWLCSHHTNVDDQKVKEAFDPVHKTVPPTETLQLVAPPNTNYVNTLVTLQTSIDQAANQNPPEPATAQQTMNNATSARIATKQLANVFRIDQEGNVHALTQKLLEDPITNVEALLRGLGPAEVNGKAKGFCAQFNLLGNKYPFNPNTREEATLQDTDAIFRPGQGALWAFYEATLKSSLQRQGSTFVANPEAQVKLTDAFVGFFNRAAALSDALYREGAGQPKLTYALTPLKSEGVQGLAITIDGQVLQAAGAGGSAKTFVWPSPGGRGEARLAVSLGGPQLGAFSYDGLWAAFRLFGDAERLVPTGGGFNVEWIVRAGGKPLTLPGGAPLTVRFLLDLKGSPAFFQKGYFAQLRCVSQAAR